MGVSSMLFKLTCVVLACMVVSAPHAAQAAISCGTVVNYLVPCLGYLRAGGQVPGPCCSGVRSLNAAAKTTPDRQTACGCLKKAVTSFPGLNPRNIEGLPGKCGVSLPYKFATSTDCSKVK